MAVSRRCSHSGDGPFFTPRISRPANTGHISGASIRTVMGDGKAPGTDWTVGVRSWPRLAAARSRAMPTTPSQSGRFGVTSKSITGSAPNTPAAGVPTVRLSASSRMPSLSSASSSSDAEHSMPFDTTPRTGFSTRVTPNPGT